MAAAVIAAFGILATVGPAYAPAAVSSVSAATQSYPRMAWPSTGKITQPYGCTGFWWEPRRGDCKHFHLGVDVADDRGTPIRAAAAGKVVYVGRDPYMSGSDRAWVVIVRHSNGVRTFYAHLIKKIIPGAAEGNWVAKGQKIGLMGASGMATGVHLHFAVIEDHEWVNPGRFLVADAPTR